MTICEKCGAVMFVDENAKFDQTEEFFKLCCPKCKHTTKKPYEHITLEDLGCHVNLQDKNFEVNFEILNKIKAFIKQNAFNLYDYYNDKFSDKYIIHSSTIFEYINELQSQIKRRYMNTEAEKIVRKYTNEDAIRAHLMKCEKRDLVELYLQTKFDKEIEKKGGR